MDFNVELQRSRARPNKAQPKLFTLSNITSDNAAFTILQLCTFNHILHSFTNLVPHTRMFSIHSYIYFYIHIFYIAQICTVHQKPPCLRIIRNALNRNCSHLFTATTLLQLFRLWYVLLPYFTENSLPKKLCFSYFVFGMFYSLISLRILYQKQLCSSYFVDLG